MGNFKISSGSGFPYEAKVDENLRLAVFAITEPEDKSMNKEGKQWSLPFTVTPVGAGDYFFYLKNTGAVDLTISDIRIMGAAPDTITYEWVTGTPVYTASSDIVPVRRNGGSFFFPTATVKQDIDITGLTSDGEIFFERIDTANKRYKLSTSSNIIIPQGSAIALKAETGTAALKGIVSLTQLDVV